jgi:hypothetical protein
MSSEWAPRQSIFKGDEASRVRLRRGIESH